MTIENEDEKEKKQFVWILCFIAHDDDYKPTPSEIDSIVICRTEQDANEARISDTLERLKDHIHDHYSSYSDLNKSQKKYLKNKDLSAIIFKDKYVKDIKLIWEMENEFIIPEYIDSLYDSEIHKRQV